MIFLDLSLNIALLVALAATFQVIESRWHMRRLTGQFLYGVLFGAVGLVDMMTPVHFMPGIIFDGRSIILSVSGLFGGPVVALIAALVCGAYRLWLGGHGAAMGLSVIAESAALGMAFYYWRRRATRSVGWAQLWAFGLLVHCVMLGLVILLPVGSRQEVWRQLSLAILGVYPLATMLICLLFLDYEKQRHSRTAIEESEARFRILFEQAIDGMLLADAGNKRFTLSNRQIQRMLGYSEAELRQMTVTDIHPAADLPVVLDQFEKQVRGEIILAPAIPMRRKDGTVFFADITSTTVRLQQRDCLLGIFRDITERKRAEEALRALSSRQQAILAAVPDIIMEVDIGKVYVWANQAGLNFFGDDVIGREAAFYFAGEQDTYQSVQSIFDGCQEDVVYVESWQRRRDGEKRLLAWWCRVLKDERGNVTGALSSARDITERKRAEEQFRESERNYGEIFNATSDAVFVHETADGRLVDVNDAMLKMYGYASKEEVLAGVPEQMNYDQPPYTAVEARNLLRLAIEEGPQTFEWLARKKTGELFWVEVALRCSTIGGNRRVLAAVRDITERKQAAKELREQAALLDAANDAIYVRMLDYTITYWNAGAERLFGWSRTEVLGHKITDLGEMDFATFDAAHATVLAQGHWSGELKKTSKEGKELVVFCRWTLLRDEQNRPSRVLAINTDVTEHKKLENQFLRAQRMEGIGALAGGIAHDLNNILLPILLSTSFLRNAVSDPESRQMIDTVEGCARRAADIIKQLLTFARGKPGVRTPLPMRHFLNEMDQLMRETFPRSIQSCVNVSEELWPILGDATQIQQALMNLCVNARDAMPDGGKMTLAAENVTLDKAFAAMPPDAMPGNYVCVSVADTGMGIPSEQQDRIFDPFFTTKEIGKGTGLGLATVLGIVRGHGGFVHVNSQVGQGTTFELYLPASPEVKTEDPVRPEPPPPQGHGELILVVDDEAGVCRVVQRMLEKHGYRVVAAREGNEALALFDAHRAEIKAVLTDLMMPRMDGPKLVHALRQLDTQLPILGMTGLAEQADMKGMEDLHLPKLLIKPFTGAKLLAVLHATLAKRD